MVNPSASVYNSVFKTRQNVAIFLYLNRWEANWSRHANGVYTETGRAPCADMSSWISNTSKPLSPPLLSPPQGSSLSAGGPQGLLDASTEPSSTGFNTLLHCLRPDQYYKPETLPSAKKETAREAQLRKLPPFIVFMVNCLPRKNCCGKIAVTKTF